MTDHQQDQPVSPAAQARGGKPPARAADTKTLLATLRMTTAVGAVGLTLAGWGMLARAASIEPAADAQSSVTSFSGSAAALAAAQTSGAAAASPRDRTRAATAPAAIAAETSAATAAETSAATAAEQAARVLPTATPAPLATATDAPTAAVARQVQLNVVEWVTTRAGDPVAVVQDNSGILWYVWGPDVTRIEQGLEPEYAPQAVNAVSRSRAS